MFGNDNQDQSAQDNPLATPQVTNPSEPVADGVLNTPAADTGAAPSDKPADAGVSSAPTVSNDAGTYIATDPPELPAPAADPVAADPTPTLPTAAATDDAELNSAVSSLTPAAASADTTASSTPSLAGGSDDLLGIKQQALQQLSPLVGHLDQTPEEKFRTTMMMIQASDDQSLVKTAYEAAQQITDEKAKAQALLDVVNEINYFTQHQPQG